MKHVELWSDGSCNTNTRQGGWGCVLVYKETQRLLAGRVVDTTNNRMELQAIISGLEALKFPCSVLVRSDSMLSVNAINRVGKHKKNLDLVHRAHELCDFHHVKAEWVEGHAGHVLNELADKLACYYSPIPETIRNQS